MRKQRLPLVCRTISRSNQQEAASSQGAFVAEHPAAVGGIGITCSGSVDLGLDNAIWTRKEEKKGELCAL